MGSGPHSSSDSDPTGVERALARLVGYWHWPNFWENCDSDAILDDLRVRLRDAVSAWNLQNVDSLDGGVVGLVCAATRDGEPVVIKLSPRVSDGRSEGLRSEGEALRFWKPTGAVVALLDTCDDGYTLLLERLLPGNMLEDEDQPVENMLIELGQLAAALHASGVPPESFLSLASASQGRRRALTGDPLAVEFDALLAGADDVALIHGDLHGRNALRHGAGWKVIDPHALRGDRHAEVQPLLEASLALPADPSGDRELITGWLNDYATAAAMNPTRTAAWTRTVARAEARNYDSRSNLNAAELAWASGLHRLADVLSD